MSGCSGCHSASVIIEGMIREIAGLEGRLNISRDLSMSLDKALDEMSKALTDAQAENQKLREALEKINSWCNAYPLKVFPEPDFKAVHKALKDAGLSLDAVSASNMRHVLDGIRGMVKDAIEKQGCALDKPGCWVQAPWMCC